MYKLNYKKMKSINMIELIIYIAKDQVDFDLKAAETGRSISGDFVDEKPIFELLTDLEDEQEYKHLKFTGKIYNLLAPDKKPHSELIPQCEQIISNAKQYIRRVQGLKLPGEAQKRAEIAIARYQAII